MTNMNVQQMTERLCRLYPRITDATKKVWFKSIKPLADVKVSKVDDEVAVNYLEDAMCNWRESTVKARIGTLKGLWRKAGYKKIYKGENPWLDLDDGLEISRRDPEVYPWEHYSYYHEDPYFVCLWYSGMRIGELAGILPEHIHMDADIPYFDLRHQPNRRLKNRESIRIVPIHTAALPYVERLYFSKAKEPGRSWSETFKKNMCLPFGDGAHSIRHSFTTRMREAGCDEYVLDALLGHKIHSMTGAYGRILPNVLSRELHKLR